MNIRPIHTDQDYRAALKSVSPLFDNEPQPGTPEGDYFDVMITLIEACLLYTSPSPRDQRGSRMPSSA